MKALRDAILAKSQTIGTDIIKVDSFLNHRVEPALIAQMADVFAQHFAPEKPDLILTVEASGIALGFATARALHDIPLVFAKKHAAQNQRGNYAQARVFSFTHKQDYHIRVDLAYLPKDARVLIIDDFLADGQAALGMMSLVEQAGAQLVGIGIAIEKGFQPGGEKLRKMGVNLLSLAVIDRIEDGHIILRDD